MRHRRARRSREVVAALVFGALLVPMVSCAGPERGEGSEARSSARGVRADSPEERQLLAAVRRYNHAFHSGAYETVMRLRNDLCRELSWEEGLSNQVEQASQRYGERQHLTSFRARVQRQIAYVSYSFEDEELDRRGEAWTLDDGTWRYADC